MGAMAQEATIVRDRQARPRARLKVRFGLRSRMLLLVVVAFLPALGYILYHADTLRRSAIADAQNEAGWLSRVAADHHGHVVREAYLFLSALARSATMADGIASDCSDRMAEVFARVAARTDDYTNLSAATPAGDLVCSATPLPGPINLADRDYFTRAMATRDFTVGDVVVSRLSGNPVVVMAYPVLREDGAVGSVLLAGIKLTSLGESESMDLAKGTVFVTFDGKGTILRRIPDNASWAGASLASTELLRRAPAGGGQATGQMAGEDGVQRIYAISRVPPTDGALYVAVGFETAGILAAQVSAMQQGVLVLAVAAAFAFAAAWLAGGRLILRPARALVDASRRLSEGDLSARIEVRGGDEIGLLTRHFNDMAASLERQQLEMQAAGAALQAENAQRRRTEETLRQANESFHAMIKSSPLAVITLDANRIVRLWNDAAERVFGFAANETVGRPLALAPEGGEAEFDRLFRRAVSGEMLRDVRVRQRRQDGSLADIAIWAAPLFDADHRPRGVLYLLDDVTERRVMGAQLAQAQKMEMVGQLTGGLAHDFNNLLSIIIGNAEYLIDCAEAKPESRECAQAALDASLRGAELTKQLLAFSRRQVLQPRVTDVNALVVGITKLLERALGGQIAVEVVAAEGLWLAMTDPAQVESALLNLAVNARDAMPSGGRLTITTANGHLDEDYARSRPEVTPGDFVTVAVTDTGTGMPPDVVKRVFEPFFTTKEAGKGSGLGLSMVYGFAKQSGGHVRIKSTVGEGTTVRLYLPRAVAGAAVAETAAPDAAFAGGGKTILVVEDNAEVRKVVVRKLKEIGYAVVEAEDAVAALDLLAGGARIDLLFSDVILPGKLTGFDLAQAASRARPQLRVLFTSGYAEDAPRDGIDLLTKPYLRDDLARKIREVLDRA